MSKRFAPFTLHDLDNIELEDIYERFEISDASDSEDSDEEVWMEEDDKPLYTELTPVKNHQGGALGLLKDISTNPMRNLFSDNGCDVTQPGPSNRGNVTFQSTPTGDAQTGPANTGTSPSLTNNTVPDDPAPQADSGDLSEDDEPLDKRIKALDGIWDDRRRKPELKPFSEHVGPKLPDDVKSPFEHFISLFPDALIEHIVYQTNLYATQRMKTYTPTNKTEIKQFIAANMMMGITRKPSYRDYWSASVQMRDPYISSLIPERRFSWLLSHLHLNDNQKLPLRTDPNYDKLYKLRPLLDILSDTYASSYDPVREQSVDESMCKFKGRSTLKQYLPKKPIKRGFKIWVRADIMGYVLQFQIYVGKTDSPENNLGARVVKDLTRQLVGKYYIIFCDNFFSSLPLFKDLLSDGIYACGTIKGGRRGLPKPSDSRKRKRGDTIAKSSYNGLSFVNWQDSKPVMLISNCYDSFEQTTASRRNKDHELQDIPCPAMVKEYNQYMGGVDKADMFKTYYHIDRKAHKWWLRLFWHFVDVTICNAYILYHLQKDVIREADNAPKYSMKEFRLAVVAGLVGTPAPSPKGRKPVAQPKKRHFKLAVPLEQRVDKAAHLPAYTPDKTRRRCCFCSRKGHEKRSNIMCKSCDVALCIPECFTKYHSVESES